MGGYFTNMMKPKNVFEVKNRMKTPKGYIPPASLNTETVINEFIEQQQHLLRLLEGTDWHDDRLALRSQPTASRALAIARPDIVSYEAFEVARQRGVIGGKQVPCVRGAETRQVPVPGIAVRRIDVRAHVLRLVPQRTGDAQHQRRAFDRRVAEPARQARFKEHQRQHCPQQRPGEAGRRDLRHTSSARRM